MLKWNSVPGSVIEMAFNGSIVPLLTVDIVSEYRNVLLRPKFHLSEPIVSDVISALEEKGVYIFPKVLNIELPDPKDKIFYEAVMEKRQENTYLITGNIKHFPKEPYIVTPREFVDVILELDND